MNKSDILDSEDLKRERVDTPEWKCGHVYVRTLHGWELDEFDKSAVDSAMKNLRASLLVRAICDENGNRLFEDADAEALGRKSAKVLDRLFEVARKLSRITTEAQEDQAKN